VPKLHSQYYVFLQHQPEHIRLGNPNVMQLIEELWHKQTLVKRKCMFILTQKMMAQKYLLIIVPHRTHRMGRNK
jgi:hypothetical protein